MPDTPVYETIQYKVKDHLCTITLNRPEVYNAINDQLTKELTDAFKNAGRDTAVRVIILTGAGKAFCSGQDLADLKQKYVEGYTPHLGDDLRKRYNPLIKRMRDTPKPIIAAVNGVAAGAGCSLALACDMRLCSEYASFIEVFINVGLIPDSASTWFLPRIVGLGKALELCYTGGKIDAQEALRLNIANKLVPADELINETTKLANHLAGLPAKGIALTKRLLYQSFDNTLNEQLEAETYAQETAGMTSDHTEGVRAFIEKRKPDFKGY